MEKWQAGHPAAPPQGNSDGVESVEVRAQCWHGGPQERPTDLSNAVNMSESVEKDATTYLVHELPDRSGLNRPQSYTCIFGFRQFVDKNKVTLTSDTDLFYQGEEGTLQIDGRDVGYITEGTNDGGKGQVFISDDRIRPSEDMQTWLSDKTVSEYSGKLWPNFRRTDVKSKNRNPWQALCNSEEGC